MKEIQLIGAGGLAKDIIACFRSEVIISGIWDDALNKGDFFYQIPVLGKISDLVHQHPIPVVIAIGNPQVRKKLFLILEEKKVQFETLIHSSARLFDAGTIIVEKACIIMPQVYLTAHIHIGSNCLLHIQSGIHHDVTVNSHSVLMPGAKITAAFTSPERYFLDTNQVKSVDK